MSILFMPRPLFVIVDWDLHFETYESKRLVKACSWVAMPNKHDGKSYRRLAREKDSMALYGAWSVIVQVASKCPVRGLLADLDGPLDFLDLEDKTGLPAKGFERALQFAAGERIGWVQIVDDPEQIEVLLQPVRGAKAGNSRRLPQTPADSAKSPQTPAGNGATPADNGNRPQSPQISADSRTSPRDPAPRGRARADSTGQDSTEPDPTTERVRASEGSILEETFLFILTLFPGSQKKRRPGGEAQHALARQVESLPLAPEQREVLTWFYALPGDERDVDLRSRFRDADKLAINLFPAIERAEAFAKKSGRVQKKEAAPEPVGWREAMEAEFPGAEMPAAYEEFLRLGASIRDRVRRRMEGGQA